MNIREAAQLMGRSRSTLYRWLRRGHTTPFEKAGLVVSKSGRKWKIEKKTSMDWHRQLYEDIASEDGLTPSDFTWLDYPISNVHLRHLKTDEYFSKDIVLVYRCDMPTDTPQLNVYVDGKKLPDPLGGSALSWVKFHLRDADTLEDLDIDQRANHTNGEVLGMLNGAGKEARSLWDKLQPGGESIRVRLYATPFFFPHMNSYGDGGNQYSRVNLGYLNGEEQKSKVYTLKMDWDGVVYIDGGAPPKAEEPVDPYAAEHDRLMEEERARHEQQERETRERAERENREHNERMEREKRRLEEEQRRELERPREEANKNESHGQGGPDKGPVAEKKEMLDSLYTAQYEGLLPDGDEQYKDILRQVIEDGPDWEAAVAEICREHGWTL